MLGQNFSQDYFLRLRYHHRNLLHLPCEEKQALVPSFEGQLLLVVKEIVFLRGRPEFKAVNEIANLLLQPARSTKKRRRLNDGQHLATGQQGRHGQKSQHPWKEQRDEKKGKNQSWATTQWSFFRWRSVGSFSTPLVLCLELL